MAYLAPPIFTNDKILLSYTNRDCLGITYTEYQRYPASQSLPEKDVLNPVSSYHVWYKTISNVESTHDEFLRNRLALIQGEPIKADTSVSRDATSKDLSMVKNVVDVDNTKRKKSKFAVEVPDEVPDALLNTQALAVNNTVIIKRNNNEDDEKKQGVVGLSQSDISETFEELKLLKWRDADEQHLKRHALDTIGANAVRKIFPIMERLAVDLANAINATTGSLEAMSLEDRNNYLFHIIAKGETMYYSSIADPDFCSYLVDQYQPLYTYMKSYIR